MCQCGLRYSSCGTCGHKGCPHDTSIIEGSVGVCSRSISCGFKKGRGTTPAFCAVVVYCGVPSEHETGTCMVTVHYGDNEDTCMVYQTAYPPHGNCKSVMEPPIMANRARGRCGL